MSLTNRILLGMLAGILLGSLLNLIGHGSSVDGTLKTIIDEWLVGGVFDVIGRIFVASLKLLVVPLVFVSLVCGSSSLGDSARMGPIAGKTLLFYL
ncbi:MAG: cation:dicarboxylase symporter family transporter, partial [Congregibacter sp.]|nr:cation:dicarboxylase symporter family transporter [Congregibacter sp.]